MHPPFYLLAKTASDPFCGHDGEEDIDAIDPLKKAPVPSTSHNIQASRAGATFARLFPKRTPLMTSILTHRSIVRVHIFRTMPIRQVLSLSCDSGSFSLTAHSEQSLSAPHAYGNWQKS